MPTPKYKTIPVDEQTHERLGKLAHAFGFGQRGFGAVVRKLVNEEYAKLLVSQLLSEEPKSAPQKTK